MSTPSADRPADDTVTSSSAGRSGAGSDTSSDAWPTTTDGETYVAGSNADTPRKRKGRGGTHLSTLVLCLLLTPVALGLVDYSVLHGWFTGDPAPTDNTPVALEGWVTMAIAAGLLLVVAGLARASGPAALLSGLVWGAAPAAVAAWRPADFTSFVLDLPDPYSRFGEGLLANSPVFVVVGALLVGVGLAGRWRNKKVDA